MSEFTNKTITNNGIVLLSAALAGGKIEFTRIVLGDGSYTGDLASITELVSLKQSLNINSIKDNGSQVTLSSTLTQSAITSDFYWKEIGVYARGDDGAEILYMYGNTENASYISSTMLNEKIINIGVLVSNAANVSAVIDDSLIFLTRQDLSSHNADANAHEPIRNWVTEQLEGLDSFLPLTGGTITGALTLPSSKFFTDGKYGLDAKNSDIIGLNGLFFSDTCNATGEGLMFPKTGTTVGTDPTTLTYYDLLNALDGVLKFNNKAVYHEGNKQKFLNDTTDTTYQGFKTNDDNESNYIRTTKNGIIPYQSTATGDISNLGTKTWQFKEVWAKNIYANGVNLATEITDLKNTSVNGKQSIADAINGVKGTSYSSTTTYADLAAAITSMHTVSSLANDTLLEVSEDDYISGATTPIVGLIACSDTRIKGTTNINCIVFIPAGRNGQYLRDDVIQSSGGLVIHEGEVCLFKQPFGGGITVWECSTTAKLILQA